MRLKPHPGADGRGLVGWQTQLQRTPAGRLHTRQQTGLAALRERMAVAKRQQQAARCRCHTHLAIDPAPAVDVGSRRAGRQWRVIDKRDALADAATAALRLDPEQKKASSDIGSQAVVAAKGIALAAEFLSDTWPAANEAVSATSAPRRTIIDTITRSPGGVTLNS